MYRDEFRAARRSGDFADTSIVIVLSFVDSAPLTAESNVVEPSPRRGMVWHGSSTLATSAAMLLLNIGTGVMLARLLGPTGRGQLAAILLWPNLFISIGSLGIGESTVYFSARMPGKERVVSASGLLIAACQAILLGGAWYILAPSILGHYGHEIVRTSQYVVLAFPLALIPLVTTGVLLGRLEVGSYNYQRLAGIALTAFGLLVLYMLRIDSLLAIVGIYLVVGSLVLGYSFVMVARERWLGFRPNRSLVGMLLSFGARSHLGTVSGIANQTADQALISIALAPYFLGIYSVALALPAGVAVIGSSLAALTLPSVTAATSAAEMRRALTQLVRTTVALSVLAAGILLLATPIIISVFFGPAFEAATPIARILILGSALLGINRVTSAGLRAFNRPLQAGAGDLLAACVTVVFLVLLVPMIGLMGAAIAVSLAYAANFIFNLWTCARLGIGPRQLVIPTVSDARAVRTLLRRHPWRNVLHRPI
jgi:O-antigen/teichoic acid export membrane protein